MHWQLSINYKVWIQTVFIQISAAGSVYCCGSGKKGQLGTGLINGRPPKESRQFQPGTVNINKQGSHRTWGKKCSMFFPWLNTFFNRLFSWEPFFQINLTPNYRRWLLQESELIAIESEICMNTLKLNTVFTIKNNIYIFKKNSNKKHFMSFLWFLFNLKCSMSFPWFSRICAGFPELWELNKMIDDIEFE